MYTTQTIPNPNPTEQTPNPAEELRREALDNLHDVISRQTALSRELRGLAKDKSGEEKHEIHLEMKQVGSYPFGSYKHDIEHGTRFYLLAQGFLRGRRYREIESKCHEGNKVNYEVLIDALSEVGWIQPEEKKGYNGGITRWTPYKIWLVYQWLNGFDTPFTLYREERRRVRSTPKPVAQKTSDPARDRQPTPVSMRRREGHQGRSCLEFLRRPSIWYVCIQWTVALLQYFERRWLETSAHHPQPA